MEPFDSVSLAALWIGGVAVGAILGKGKGRLVEGILLPLVLGLIGIIIVVILPAKGQPAKPVGTHQPYWKSMPVAHASPSKGAASCGCAALFTVGVLLAFMGLGMSSPSSDMASFFNVLFIGFVSGAPGAVCIYSGLVHFSVSETIAKVAGGVYFALIFAMCWILLAQFAADAMRIYGH
ncbi:MAG: hypothetical protein M3R13_11620 [Armatimonadota bacterium]|nr:hypothetical protein [Armatimonadota bacterium]